MQSYFLLECPEEPIGSIDVINSHCRQDILGHSEGCLLALTCWNKSVRLYDPQIPYEMNLNDNFKYNSANETLERPDVLQSTSATAQSPKYISTGKCIQSIQCEYIYLACKFKDDSTIFLGGFNEAVDFIDLQDSLYSPRKLVGHLAPVRCLSLLEKNSILASGDWDGEVKLTSINGGNFGSQVSRISVPGKVFCMDYSYNEEWLLVGDSLKNMNLINLRKLSSGIEATPPTEIIPNFMKYQMRSICANRHKDVFATSSIEGRVQITSVDKALKGEINNKECPKDNYAFKCHRTKDNSMMTETIYPVNSVCFHPQFENVLATGGSDTSVFLWDISAKKRLWRNSNFQLVDSEKNLIRTCNEGVSSLKFHPTLPYLISSCCDTFDQSCRFSSETRDQVKGGPNSTPAQRSSIIFHSVHGVKPLE
ncbi:BUB3-like protein with WD40 repeats [Cryptosporidium ubiquitum]|uniref:BUB3-like protein with WD40 repeats n=1 Tax=Cryptosporidium ubiquitum TaxID=857276 RepID=A0A1J4MDZ2_9CRYT|nr:BUB3-like protein with WD40 repeats [Cryptosporidium ubiquitum]OII72458.1 BUB3-like protein with WD40 repeats [Cryptosporidium ubiquitum]